jgi:hypothetical protein
MLQKRKLRQARWPPSKPRSVGLRKDAQITFREAARGDSQCPVFCRKVLLKSDHRGARRGAGLHGGRGDGADQGESSVDLGGARVRTLGLGVTLPWEL